MPQVDFTIDPATGKLELHVRGIAGPACEDVARLAKELLGTPEQERTTPEYYVRSLTRPQVQRKPGA